MKKSKKHTWGKASRSGYNALKFSLSGNSGCRRTVSYSRKDEVSYSNKGYPLFYPQTFAYSYSGYFFNAFSDSTRIVSESGSRYQPRYLAITPGKTEYVYDV